MDRKKLDNIYEFLEPRITKFERRRKEDQQRKTFDEVFDQSTLLGLYKLIRDGEIDLVDFPADYADAKLSGASEATINVKRKLDSVLSGASRLYFQGNPTIGDISISGASTIKHK